jgi:hypothetical protein
VGSTLVLAHPLYYKRLVQLASIIFGTIIRAFYEHQSYDCSRPDFLVSSIDGREVEVTIADVAAVLKCSHEPPESDVPWLECPSMLTLEDIVSDMCEGAICRQAPKCSQQGEDSSESSIH